MATQTSQVAAQTAVHLSSIMFAPKDAVRTKNRMNPFWMTVMSVNPRNGYCQCNFGHSGNYAGNFHFSELTFEGGEQIQQAANLPLPGHI
ncbi:hypothetical protein ACI77O_12370 [Pseudomonas tritici]|uniref:hypothetical protein n=1 Tax=Pseudomonas tritici TaxID=2745518 RepID=UPI00387B2201